MAQDDIFQEFINKLKKEKSEAELGKFVADLLKFSSAELYFTILTQLTEEDMEAIDKIEDEKRADEELINRFKKRTGMTPQQFIVKLRDKIAKGYLFPELQKK